LFVVEIIEILGVTMSYSQIEVLWGRCEYTVLAL
jgi:hypothetical protein